MTCKHGFKDSETCPIETPYPNDPKPMTVEERAEKMVQAMLAGLGENKSYYEYFLGELRTVQEEAAFMRDCKDGKDHVHGTCPVIEKSNKAIRREALEKAAEIVESFEPLDIQPHIDSTKKALSDCIRKLASEPNP